MAVKERAVLKRGVCQAAWQHGLGNACKHLLIESGIFLIQAIKAINMIRGINCLRNRYSIG
ncbi:MAG: hypothetical protein F6K42_14590 [Leptolyngbya sp. SIO1D8]|nr:hypothetical protein [Leptolyngbya sp. SIO1D8]